MEDQHKEKPKFAAFDVHVHVKTGERRTAGDARMEAARKYFKSPKQEPDADQIAAYYRSLGLRAVIFDVDQESQTGQKISNDEISDAVKRNPDVFTGFASVDPWKGEGAIREVKRCANELGLKGVKFQPITQGFFPDDSRFYPLYEACQELGLIVLFHTGTTGIGANTPGGLGLHLKYGKPIPHLDDVAADFPDLKIIAAHPSWPWQEEMLAVAVHKANVYIDLSGWAPKYFPKSLLQYANSLLKDKILFGTDYPWIDPKRWLDEFKELEIKEEVRPKILYENALKLFKSAD